MYTANSKVYFIPAHFDFDDINNFWNSMLTEDMCTANSEVDFIPAH